MTAPFVAVCRLDEIDREGGVTALVEGRAVAVFRTQADDVFALGNYDPFSHASVLARGLLGTLDRDGAVVDFVASPMHKQRFDLRTGRCLEDAGVAVPVYRVTVETGVVSVAGVPEDGEERAA